MAFFHAPHYFTIYAYIIALNDNVECSNGMPINDGMISAGADLGFLPRGAQPPKQFDKQNKKRIPEHPLLISVCAVLSCVSYVQEKLFEKRMTSIFKSITF